MKNLSWTTKLAVLLVSTLTIMSILTISPALPEMNQAFANVPNAQFIVKLTFTIPALLIALSALVAGILIDKYGRLRFLWAAMVFYAIGGTAGFWLENIYHILISRIVLGVAVGVTMTIVTTLIADYFEGLNRQKFIGIQIAFMSLGGILFLGLGGVLADVGWRFPFLIYFYSLLILPFAFLYLKEPDKIVMEDIPIKGFKSPSIIWFLFINTMVMWILFFLIPVQAPFHLKEIGIEQNSLIGLAIAMSTAFSAVSSFSYSKLKNRFGFLSIFAAGYFLMAVGFAIISIADNYLIVCLSMILTGFGIGMMIPNTNMWVMKIAPPQIRGKEIGRLTTFWFMGQFLSPIILQPFAQSMSSSSLFMAVAGFLLVLFFVFLFANVFFKKQLSAQ